MILRIAHALGARSRRMRTDANIRNYWRSRRQRRSVSLVNGSSAPCPITCLTWLQDPFELDRIMRERPPEIVHEVVLCAWRGYHRTRRAPAGTVLHPRGSFTLAIFSLAVSRRSRHAAVMRAWPRFTAINVRGAPRIRDRPGHMLPASPASAPPPRRPVDTDRPSLPRKSQALTLADFLVAAA